MTTTTDELTDKQYDLADAIELWLEKHAGHHNRSTIARGVKSTTTEVAPVLEWMLRHVFVVASGNGAWTRFGSRH